MKVYAQCLVQVSNFIVKIVFQKSIDTVDNMKFDRKLLFFRNIFLHISNEYNVDILFRPIFIKMSLDLLNTWGVVKYCQYNLSISPTS